MTKAEVRAKAILWLRARNPPVRTYRGLDHRRIHFECGCSIIHPSGRAFPGARAYNPGCRSHICGDHQRALGRGMEL